MRESQYVDSYLDYARTHRATPGSFLSYALHGKAKGYGAKYLDALQTALQRRIDNGTVVAVRSTGGSTAFVRVEDRTPNDQPAPTGSLRLSRRGT
jgi:hypothetical protein